MEKQCTIPDDKVKERSWVLAFTYNPSLQILLARDDEGRWSFPGGQLDDEETAEEAAWREFGEETHIKPDKIHFLKTVYHDKPNKLKVSHVFYTEVSKDVKLRPSDDVDKLKWFKLDDLPNMGDLSKPKKEVARLAAEKIHDPKKELKESIEFIKRMGLPFHRHLLLEKKRKTNSGYLIVMEGIDGAGKSTQHKILSKWLEGKGWKVTTSRWATSPHISKVIKDGKKNKWLTPTLFSLLHASDMVWRFENEIKPALEKGHVVICDRYYYTSYARDTLRGIQKEMLDTIYNGFEEPDLIIHFIVPPRLAVERLMKDKGFKWYSSGMDIGYDKDMEKSAAVYETKMDSAYKKLLPTFKNYMSVSSERSIREIFEEIRGYIHKKIKGLERGRVEEKLSFSKVMNNVLTEEMSFRQLLKVSDEKPDNSRFDRARHVNTKSLGVRTIDENEAWTFSYKSQGNHSTTGMRHKGYVRFLKEHVAANENVENLPCMVDCSCPDYRYRWAYNNAKAGAGETGSGTLNQNNGRPPRPRDARPPGVGNLGEGLCKHLIALGRFLETSVNAPSPDDEKPIAPEKPEKKQITRPSQAPTTSNAPDPNDTYNDSRSGDTYSDGRELQQEGQGMLMNRFLEFVRTHPEFEVPYE